MSNIKNGFSTLNRWLGKKNKDKSSLSNGKHSKSNTNLSMSVSTNELNETSPMEYNRITPLPVVTSNAPFEQTFRITVLLPKDQLYVTRLGARVPLSKLKELVCENKQLDGDKYEFRNPVDSRQVFNCELTIGAVGLSEMRLCLKSDPYDNFNSDEVIKLHRTSLIRESLSSSEYSSRNSKPHTLQTTSPYSSSNSLNSMDSSGVNYTKPMTVSTNPQPNNSTPKVVVAAPPRKKRAAPRPPSQLVIPEKSALIIENGNAEHKTESPLKETVLPRKDYYVSTPNLSSPTMMNGNAKQIDCNGNNKVLDNCNQNGDINAEVEQRNVKNLYRGSVQNLCSMSEEANAKLPEPSPRKRLIQIKKKSAPIAPLARNGNYAEDSLSIASTTPSTVGTPDSIDINELGSFPTVNAVDIGKQPTTPATPQPLARETVQTVQTPQPITEQCDAAKPQPQPVPRSTTTTSFLYGNCISHEKTEASPATSPTENPNISKVMLNCSPTPEPRSLSTEPPEIVERFESQLAQIKSACNYEDDDNVSKQADSGIGEPVPSPIPDSLNSEGSTQEVKSNFESSSDDDDMIKVYNFKLGKTMHKPLEEHKTLEELTILTAAQTDSGENTPSLQTAEPTPSASDTTSWNFAIPISPPPNFADKTEVSIIKEEKMPDTPITPIIKERPTLNFEAALTPDVIKGTKATAAPKETTPLASPMTPFNNIVNELHEFLQDKGMDTLNRKPEEVAQIESAKPNTLSNFSITTLSQQTISSSTVADERTEESNVELTTTPPNEDKQYHKRGSNNNLLQKQRKSITRSDSFHTTALVSPSTAANGKSFDGSFEQGLNARSSSQLSLTKLEQNGLNLNRRRSSSELSIGESPSLQSLEVIKTILNSRKNSLNNSSDNVTKQTNKQEELIMAVESKFKLNEDFKVTSVELKPKKEETVNETATAEKTAAVTKEIPKVYRYSGPPSINFSTWSERPKVKVAIKNEGDYIFGGQNAGGSNAAVTRAHVDINTHSMPRSYRTSTPASNVKLRHFEAEENEPKVENKFIEDLLKSADSLKKKPPVAAKPETTINRMGIPEKEFRVPVTVKPLNDVTVENVVPVETKVKMESNETQTLPRNLNAANTLPRSNSNRFSMPAVKSKPLSTPGPAMLRTTTIAPTETKSSQEEEVSAPAAPFGQNTLRRTGFKEKMLAKEQAAANQQKNVKPAVVTAHTTPKPAPTTTTVAAASKVTVLTNGNHVSQKPAEKPKTLQAANLHLNLQNSNNSTPLFNVTKNTVTVNRVITPKSAPVAPPAPPPAPKVVLKSRSVSTTPIGNADPRDQLLEAIRNFKKDELKSS